MNKTDKTIFIKADIINQKNTFKNILLMIFLILFLSSVSFSVNAAPDGYCQETISDIRLATWITNVDYELFPNAEDPEAIKITVDIFFTTEGICLAGFPCQPDPECDEDFRYVNAWIDWDGDYNFDPSEQVLDEELFWYDENYQDWLINTYEGDPLDMLNISLLPRENFTGKSIRWFTYESFAGGMGIMTITKIITLPDSYRNDTWMRVNYGWLYDPQIACELYEPSLNPPGADPYDYWEYGDATYKEISTTPDLFINSSDISIKQKTTPKFIYHDFKDAILTVTVHNNGKTEVNNVDVLLYKTDSDQLIVSSDTKTISNIAAESSVNVSFQGNFNPYRFEDIWIEVDPENKIWETNESNNDAKTYSITGYIFQHNITTTHLPRTRVDIQQYNGTSYQFSSITITDDTGLYKFWTNSEYLEIGRKTYVSASLEYLPTRQFPAAIYVLNETAFGDNILPKTPTTLNSNLKLTAGWILQDSQDSTHHITFSGIEGGLAYQTLITLYNYHKNQNTAPSHHVVVNINDNDGDNINDNNAYAYQNGYTIHLPPGREGTTDPFTIGHEFTHIVENGWLPTYYGHHPLVPVEEGSCHWGSCIALKNPVLEFEDGRGGFVTIDVSNTAHTSNSTPAPTAFVGCREEFQIAGTMWDLNTTLVWRILRYGYGALNPLWPSTPLLFYNAYKEVDSRSSLVIKGIFQSHAYNTSTWPGKDGVDPDYFTGTFSDQGIDYDGDGIYDSLQIEVELNISQPGDYILTGSIGETNIGSSTTATLTSGLNIVNLTFYGENIYEAQQNGPYNLSFYLYYANYTFLDNRISFYETQPYSYTEFERPTIIFTGNTNIATVDEDGDGTYDQLVVDLELNLTESSYVKMYAGLYCNDVFVDNCWGPSMNDGAVYEYVEAGVNTISLYFNGESIYSSKQNGSYEIQTHLANGRTLELGSFHYTDFDAPPAILGSLISELTHDEDSDGYIDTLNINLTVVGEGNYQLTGHLYNESGAHLITTHTIGDINTTQSLLLSFDGENLRDQQQSGVYNLIVEIYDMAGSFIGYKNYTLSAYSYEDFEPSADELFAISYDDYGINNTGQFGYETLCIDMDVSTLQPGLYKVEGYLSREDGMMLCSIEAEGFFDGTISSLNLYFDGQTLGASRYNGSYNLDLVFKNESTLVELTQAYITGYYSYDSFETSYFVNATDMLYSTAGLHPHPNKLGVTVETYSTVPRYVTIKAQLRDSAGELIDETKISDIWAFKNDSTLLLFDGSKIYDHGIDGPYTVVLRLYDEDENLLDIYTGTTNYYDHSLFSLVTLTDTYTDYDIDLNSDTVFDYLVIEADVHVSTDGFCTITGTLEDATGETIITSENTLWLPEGLQILPLYFNGSEIKNHGVNGPYYLKHVVVSHNADVTITDYAVDAYVTSVYDYNNFTLSATILANQKPVSIASGPKGGTTGESLLFNASASYDPEGQSLAYLWEFGDGTTSILENPAYTYSTDGIYTVNLTVNDSAQDSYPKKLIVSIGYPVADTGGPYTVYGIQPLFFNSSASFDPEEGPLTYSWEFGDGSISTEANPMHTYATEGVYTVTLTVHDETYDSIASTTVTVLKSLFFDGETADEGYDEDSDGLYEYLLVETDVTNYVSQTVSVEVTLTDSFGTILSYGLDTEYLNISSYKLSIYFDGPTFFENMVDGPYYVEIIIRDESDVVLDSMNYTTAAYEYTDFQYNTKIGNVTDYGIDTDMNGFYDHLAADVTLITYVNRDVVLHGELFDSNGTSIVSTQKATTLTGNTTIQLLFDGKTINSHGENGSYTVILNLKDEYGLTIDTKENSTFAYHYTDFEEQTSQIWTVDDDNLDIPSPPADFSTIQEAIDAATDGDEIRVYTGTYYESVDLNKSLILTGIGSPEINADWSGHDIKVTADGCIIQGFFLTNAHMGGPGIYTAGIYVLSGNNTIRDNSFEYNENGISLVQAHDNVVENNTLIVTSYNTEGHNIILLEAKRNTIIENSCLGGGKGITVINSSSNLIYLNTLGNGNYNGHDNSQDNMWNSTDPVEYVYKGSVYSSRVGNYWEDHVSNDTDNDGIYDTPYTNIEGLGNVTDYYPMVGNWPPTADANGPYRAGDEENITFNSTGSFDPDGDPLTYFWDFDDGNYSTDANPVYAYNLSDGERDKFYVEITVSDGVYIDTDTATAYINYPVAVAGGPYYGVEGVSITLDGSASYDPLAEPYQSYPIQHYWYPADGWSGSWSVSSKKYVTYDDEGEYRPYLQVRTNTGYPRYYSGNSYTTVYVNDTDPVPDFASDQQNGQVPLTIEFTDQSTSYDGITLWEWDFDGDGITDAAGTNDTARNPSFTYLTAGNYAVNLTVYEADGDMVSMIKTDYIIVNTPRPPITIYVPDDYPSIQEAIDAGTTMDRDTIIIRDGVYKQNTLVNKELIIRSENGSEHCHLFPEIPLNHHMITIISDNVTIDGFFMNGTRSWYDEPGSLYVNEVDNVTICNNWINDSSHGIVLENAHNITIMNNAIINNDDAGIYGYEYYSDNEFITIIGNNLSHNKGSGLLLSGDYHIISNNTVNNNTGSGLRLHGEYHIISNNTVNNNGHGIKCSNYNEIIGNTINNNWDGLRTGNGNIISNNTVNSNYDGLFLDGAYNVVHDNIMQENTFYDLYTKYNNNVYLNTGSGNRPIIYANETIIIENMVISSLILIDADYSLIKNVTVAGSETLRNNGIYTRSCDYVEFINVTSNHNYQGIDMPPESYSVLVGQADNIFTDCSFKDNRRAGIRSGGNRNKIENCDISFNQNYGVYFYEFSKDSSIVNSTLNNNSWDGIYLRVDFTIFNISNNTITGNGDGVYCTSGDYFGYPWSNVTIAHNTISNNNYDGIEIHDGDDHNYYIHDNIIIDNDDSGLFILVQYCNFEVFNNTITGNDEGISCENTYWDENAHVNITHNTILDNNYGIGINKIKDHPNNYLISDNIIEYNAVYGIYVSPVSGTLQIVNNSIIGNANGIYCNHETTTGITTHVTIGRNTILDNDDAINITDKSISHTYLIHNTIIENNAAHGIFITSFSGTLQIVNNMITENNDGIYCENSICDANAQAAITHNIISHNNNTGIRTNDLSIQFLIYDNIIVNNSVHDIAENSWNITKTSGPNIIGGPYIGGNYWSDYAGVDNGGDFLGDTDIPFNASGEITTGGDHHPLVMSQELYLLPIQDQMMYEDTIRSIPVCALGTDINAIVLSADGLPSFGVFSDEGNGIGIIDFMPDSGDKGEYMIIISATDGINTATESFNLLVLATDYLPVASYIFEPQTPTTLQTIYFNSTSTDPDGALVNWTWDMGDGTHCYGEQIQYQYTAAATYEICLTVEDNNGFMDTTYQSIVVEAPFIDVGVNTILSPEEGDEVGIIPVQIEVQNYGNTYETDIIVNVKIGNIIGDPITLLAENFSSLTTGEIPTNWTRTHVNWGAVPASHTGSSYPEMRFNWTPSATDIFRLSTYPIDTVGYTTLEISFKHFLDHYRVPYTLHVQSSTDGSNWSDVWSVDPTGGIGPETINILLDAGDGVGSDTFYLAWTFEGNSYNVDYWYIDDILVCTPPTSVNVYNQTINIDLSFGEQLLVDSFPDWTGMTAGSYYVETCVQIPGDVNPNNNCLFEIIQVNGTSTNQPPIADAGGPYSGLLGEDIQLDGSGSVDNDGFIVVYEWDLDNDGQYDDASGVTLPFSWLAAGSYPISLRVTDDEGANDTDDTTVEITASNQLPVAVNDSYVLFEDSTLLIAEPGILGNDSDGDMDSLFATLLQNTSHGALILYNNGSFTYTPYENYSGFDGFTYTASDGTDESNIAIVNITISPINDAPNANDDSFTVLEDSGNTIFDVLDNDTDVEDDSLLIESVTQSVHGTVTNNGYNITYTSHTDYCGPDSFTYTISDGHGTDTATVNVMVTCVNDPPTAYDDVYTVAEDSSNTILSVLENDDIFPDTGETLSIASVDTPNNGGVISIIEGIPDTLSYTPAPDFFGIESFNYTVTDEQGGFDTALVTITVTAVNNPPVAYNDSYTLQENSMLIIPEPGILSNDVDPESDTLTAVLDTDVSHGTLILYLDGSFDYTPAIEWCGTDTFTYQANDGSTHSNIAAVYLIVQPVNTAPVIAPITDLPVDENDTVTVLISASDADDDALTLSVLEVPSFAVFIDNGDGSGSIVFTPGFNDAGLYQLTLTVSDGILSDSTVFNITVNNVNRPPLIPSNPTPLDEALDCDVNTDLSWIGGDPDSDDAVTYDVYFGETNQLSLLVNNQTDVTYDPGTLNPGITFYWQVISWDNHDGKTEGPIWNFTTVYAAEISIQKTVSLDNISWHDAVIVESDEVLYWNITVENTGDVLLLDVMVIDDLFTNYEVFPLACNEKRSFYYTTISSTDLNNTASVEGTDPYGNIISDTDWASVFVTVAETIDLELSKTASLDYASDDEYEGLSHGFWKNHEEEWVGYLPSDMTGDIFDIPDELSSVHDTLRNALRFKGGKGVEKAAKLLMVQSAAALLNTAHPYINYPFSESALISNVNDALASLNRQTMLSLKDTLDEYNNLGGDLKDCCKNTVCTITYIITLNNNGSTDATGINVTDILPENLTYISSETTLGSYDVTTGIWAVGFLQAYGNSYLEIVVETNVSGSYSNTAEVTYANEVDSDSIPNNHDASEDDQDMIIVEVILGADCD